MKPLAQLPPRERGRIVADRVSCQIREVAPAGLGHWDPVFTLVTTESDAFCDRLMEWTVEDTPDTRDRLEIATADLVEAWRRAGQEWELAGKPAVEDREVTHHA